MKYIQKIGGILFVLLMIALGACCIGIYQSYLHETQKNSELNEQIALLKLQAKESAIMQSVNAQMEEIADQERKISEEQREEALQQSRLANDARRHAEKERQNAQEAEKRAIESSKIATKERVIAEEQRLQAENSKRIADTLSYIALGRSLGSLSINQRAAGNRELSDLLAYAAYQFTERYHGDVYNSMIYTALLQASQGKRVWSKHRGAISNVFFQPKNDFYFVSTSRYGELFEHRIGEKSLKTTTIFENKAFDFRDLYVDKSKNIFAVSRNGFLVTRIGGSVQTLPIEEMLHPMGISELGNDLLIIGEQSIALYSKSKNAITQRQKLPFKVIAFGRYQHCPVLFDNQKQMHLIKGIRQIQTSKLPFNGQVTAYACSNKLNLNAYGLEDGTIMYVDHKGNTKKLLGHRSRITKIKINGWRIYSASYDGKLNLWMGNDEKIEPITLFTTNSWITTFTFDSSKFNIWAGDQRGNLTEAFFDVNMMFMRLKDKLTRNLTPEEWKFYIGKNIPYEKYIRKEGVK